MVIFLIFSSFLIWHTTLTSFPLVSASGYIASGSTCSPVYARFSNNDFANVGNSVMVVATSEATCIGSCSATLGSGQSRIHLLTPIVLTSNTSGYLGVTYIAAGSFCICRSTIIAGLTLRANSGWTASLLGMCSTYVSSGSSFNSTCQNVYYFNGNCLGSDGTTCSTSL